MTDSTAKQFDARFDALSRKLRKVDVEKIDACYDELADFLASDPAATIAFLGRCDAKRLKVAETVLESVADRVGDDAFVAALVAVQERLSEFEFDLTFALDAARIGAARRAMKSGAKGLSPLEAYREVLAAAESGDADARRRGRARDGDESARLRKSRRRCDSRFAVEHGDKNDFDGWFKRFDRNDSKIVKNKKNGAFALITIDFQSRFLYKLNCV